MLIWHGLPGARNMSRISLFTYQFIKGDFYGLATGI
jgi:hypothetical protein